MTLKSAVRKFYGDGVEIVGGIIVPNNFGENLLNVLADDNVRIPEMYDYDGYRVPKEGEYIFIQEKWTQNNYNGLTAKYHVLVPKKVKSVIFRPLLDKEGKRVFRRALEGEWYLFEDQFKRVSGGGLSTSRTSTSFPFYIYTRHEIDE